ncbi:MAG: N-acetylmuramoyl-L-alanine amidase [Sphingomonadales bacterium]|nr:N-acetylmuramoyl-L-alanine amidase [Sphingomonadales bacterium]
MPRVVQILVLILAPLAVFAAMVWADRTYGTPGRGRDYVVRIDLPPAGGTLGLPKIEGPLDASRPLVVIDAGHGGHDPGAGSGELKEKALTLSLALALRNRLLADGGVRVALTRDTDRYLFLEERSGIARRLRADLFVSIHADSTEAGDGDATGGTVYTLSERGSNETAERMAARENRADTINGVALKGASDAVSAILVDLSQRETQAQSDEFGRMILREGAGRMTFKEAGLQSAAFVVLKSPDVPSVLFEAGYISNPKDSGWLASSTGREAFAGLTARAIRVYFARRSGAGIASPAPQSAGSPASAQDGA